MADNDVLGKADALLQRHRAARAAQRPEPPVEFPVLTDVVSEGQPPAAAPPAPPAPAPALSEADLARIERDLRLELLGLLGPEFERLVEAKVHERLGLKVDEIMALTRKVLEAEVRAAVRDAMAAVITAETARLKGDD
ncbi:MAG: hypothetical protein ACM36B_02170 [Bacteroidota bacterium]|jgi:hypothetical protein